MDIFESRQSPTVSTQMYFIDPVPVIKEKAPIKKGDMVRWNSSGGPAYGKVVHIMKEGVLGVPDSKFKINAKPDDPAVLIQIYKGAKETDVFVGHKMSTLKLASMRKEADITKAQPDMGEVHVDAPLGSSKKKPKMVNGYEIYVDEEMLTKASMQYMPLVNSLKQWLADLTAFYLKAHGYHWNVEGDDFAQYHELFGEIYSSAYNEVDPTGEYIRVYDEYAPSDMNIFLAQAQIKSKPLSSTDPVTMAQDLYNDNKILLMDLKDVFNNGNTNNEQGLLNFIAAVIQEHQKWEYQLRSSIKEVEEPEIEMENENIGMNAQGMNMMNDMFKAMKTEGGEQFPAEAFAYVPDAKMPSTWKLRLWDSPSEKETPRQVGYAIAALGKGYRGNKVELPSDAVKGVKAKVLAAWKKTHPDMTEADAPDVLK